MNLTVWGIVLAVLIGLNFVRLPILVWVILWPVTVYVLVRFGMTPLVPASILNIYLGLTVVAVIAYILADDERSESVRVQLLTFIGDKKYTAHLATVTILLPILVAGSVWLKAHSEVRASTFGRTIHPAPPNSITFKGKTIDLSAGDNPYRELKEHDPDAFRQHVANGKRVYYQNCTFCHGDDMNGDGNFAHGFTPRPANLNSPTTISMFQETYLFWRIAKGGPGLPEEAGPWSSSMPAWEEFLSEEEIWDVILYLYEYTGLNPREKEEGH